MNFAVTVALGKDISALNINQFVEHVKRMHVKRDKGFEEEFKVHSSFSKHKDP